VLELHARKRCKVQTAFAQLDVVERASVDLDSGELAGGNRHPAPNGSLQLGIREIAAIERNVARLHPRKSRIGEVDLREARFR
jgi:hypothetical protein